MQHRHGKPLAAQKHWYLISLLGLILVFVSDFLTPLGFAHGTLYILFVLTASLSRRTSFIIFIAAMSILLTLLGATVSPPGFTMAYVAGNRFFSVVTIATTALGGVFALRHLERTASISEHLQKVIAESNQRDTLLKIAGEIAHFGGWAIFFPGSPVLPAGGGEPKMVWTDEVARIHGHPPGFTPSIEEGINYYLPGDRDKLQQAYELCRTQGVPYDMELQIRTCDGRHVWVRTTAQPVYDAEGNIIQVQGAFQDLTWEKQLTEVLFESQRRFQRMADALPLIIWTANKQGEIDYASQALTEYTGIASKDLLPEQRWLNSVYEEDRALCIASWLQAAKQKIDYAAEFRLINTQQQARWHLVYAKPARDNEGNVIKWYGTAIDIHDHRTLERELRKSEERLSYLAKATTDAIWDWDPVNEVLWWSDGLYTLFGYAPQQWETRGELWSEKIHPDDRQRVVPSILDAVRGKIVDWEQEYRFQRADGTYAHVMDRGFVIRDEQGNATRMVGGISDVTEHKNMEEQLQQAERLKAVGQLTGGVAHDFNNLLTIILGNSELLTEELAGQDRLLSLATVTRDAALRGADLTQRLLAFARKQALEPRVVNIKQLIDSMEALLRRTLNANIDIELVHTGGLWHAHVDPAQLEGALLNLCLNARDAMSNGGHLTIESSNTHLDDTYVSRNGDVEPGQYVMIAISDTGCGISAAYVDRVFDPFFTTKGIGKGTGLGLSMVYGFVKQSNGHIKLYSEPDQGTTIRMYLPRAHDEEPVQDDRPTVRTTGGSEHILLVEDDTLVREFVERQLKGLGYQVISAADASIALELLKTDVKVDLLFTDVMMPGEMNGRLLAEAAVALRPGLKVLYTSGYTENAIVHHGRLDPGVQLLSKPYRRSDLASKIRNVLSTHNLR